MNKVLFVTNDAWFFVSHRLSIAEAVLESGMEAVVAAHADDSVAQIREAGCQFDAWRVAPRGKSVFKEIFAFFSLAIILRKHKPDLVHLITVKSVLYGGILARLLRVRACVYAVSGLGSVFLAESFRGKVLRTLIKPVYRFAVNHPNSVLIFQNPDDRKIMLKQLDKPDLSTRLIQGSGVDLSLFEVVVEPQGVPVVTLAARLLKDKGILEFIEAARQLKLSGVEGIFQIAGGNIADGNPAAFSESELEILSANGYVEMLGHCTDIPGLFANSSIVVLPSYREGLPKVLIEAGAAGRPIVTTDVPGCRDAVVENKTAFLVPPRDSEMLADAMLRLLLNRELRIRMGLEGRKLVETEMSIDNVVRRHWEIYQSLLGPVE